MEQPLMDALAAHEYTRRAPVVIQSIETANLRVLRTRVPRGGNTRLLQLFGGPDDRPYDTVLAGSATMFARMAAAEGLRDIVTYADAIGPAYLMLQMQPRARHDTMVQSPRAAACAVMP